MIHFIVFIFPSFNQFLFFTCEITLHCMVPSVAQHPELFESFFFFFSELTFMITQHMNVYKMKR